MSNTIIQHRRSSVAGRQPNTTNSANTQYINPGELAVNMTDQIVYTSNGTVFFIVGANTVNQAVSTLLVVGNSTVNVAINNSTIWTGNATVNTSVNATGFYVNGSLLTPGGGSFSNGTAYTFSAVETFNANVAIVGNTTALLLIGNTTVNAAINSTTVLLSDAGTNTYLQNTGTMTVGNTTVNTSINSTTFSGIANNATNLGGQAASYYTNATNIATGTLPYAQLGGNVVNTSGSFTITGVDTFNANIAIVGNTTAVLDIGQAAANIIANSTAIIIAVNSTFSTTINGTAISIGNSTVNTISNSTVETFGNSTVNTSVNATGFYINGTAIVSATLTANNTDTQTYYLGMSNAISGSWANAVIATTELYFVPSTGILSATGFNSLSDYTLKKNITPLLNPINTLCRIQGVSFNWIRTGRKSYGIIAQELEKILPDLVDTSEYGIKTINYAGIVPFLIEAIKELSDRVEILENAKP